MGSTMVRTKRCMLHVSIPPIELTFFDMLLKIIEYPNEEIFASDTVTTLYHHWPLELMLYVPFRRESVGTNVHVSYEGIGCWLTKIIV